MQSIKGLSRPILVTICTFGAWELVTRTGLFDPLLLPPFSKVLKRTFMLLFHRDLIQHLFSSLWRVTMGFSLSIAIAFPLGIFLGVFKSIESYVGALLGFFRPLAPPAWIPIAILWFGIGDKAAIFIIFVGTFFSTLTGIVAGVRRLDKDLISVALTFGADLKQVLWYVVFPSLLPTFFAQARIALALSWMCVVASEMVAVRKGIGFMMMEARNLFRTEDIFVGMFVVGFIGLSMDYLLRLIEERIMSWRRGLSAHEFLETH